MSLQKILITGGHGMLSSALVPELQTEFELIPLDSKSLDVTNFQDVKKCLSEHKPDIVIHTAAMTNVEKCETEKDDSYRINAMGTSNLVQVLRGRDVKFIYLSSTGSYGRAKDEPFTEFDVVEPTTIHHKSKIEGEKVIQDHLDNFLILRTGWLYGGSIDQPKNFVYKRYLEGSEKEVVYSDDKQVGNPTYVKNLAEQIKVLLKADLVGVFNCVDSGVASRYEYVKEIMSAFELSCKVEVAPANFFKRVAPVSPNESAINYKLNLMGLNVMRDWKLSLNEFVEELKQNIP